jgi:serine/threonine protein kinase
MSVQSFGRYELIRKLATGGMAEVWLAQQMGIEGFTRQIVIKRILPNLAEDEEFVRMFLNEAKISAKFSHPNIGQVFDLGQLDGAYYLAMEYIHGEDLGRVMRKAWSTGQWISAPVALRIVASACEGLAYAHSRTDEANRPLNVVHRDISPQNLLISFDGAVKVVDFGIAKAADLTTATKSGALKGKFAYMAPEQAGGKVLDARADIFAIGLVLYELLTGVRPLKKESELATLQAALACQIELPSQVADVPAELDSVVMRALARDPADRYDDARQFQAALEEFLVSQRWVVGSVQVAELMKTLFKDRLEAEARGEYQRSPSSSQPIAITPSNVGQPKRPPDISWDAPIGTSNPSSRAPTSGHAGTQQASRAGQTRGSAPPPVPSPEEVSESDLQRTRASSAEREALQSQARARVTSWEAPEGELPPAPPRARPSAEGVPSRGSTTALKRASSSAAVRREPTREPIRAPTPTPPTEGSRPSRRSALFASRPPMPRAPSRDLEPVADEPSHSSLPQLGELRSLPLVKGVVWTLVVVLAVTLALHWNSWVRPQWERLLGSQDLEGRGVPIFISAVSNIPGEVVAIHAEKGAMGKETVLGELPLSHAMGAHVGDTIVIRNRTQGALYKQLIKFGEPGEEKTIHKEFRRGKVLPQLLNAPAKGLAFYIEGEKVADYSPRLKFDLWDGEYEVELRGDPLLRPVSFHLTVKGDDVVKTPVVDLRKYLRPVPRSE